MLLSLFGPFARLQPRSIACLVLLSIGCSLMSRPAEAQTADSPALLKSMFIYEQAPFPSCHASTLAETPSGLVAAWFGGTHENHPDVGIWFSRLQDGQWSTPVEVANGVQHSTLRWPCWNPVLFQAPNGPLVLFYKVGPTPQTWWGMRMTSDDGGLTWTEPTRLPDQILGPIKNKPVLLPSGELLCPTSEESVEQPSKWTVHLERTSDLGKTWSRTGPMNDGLELAAIQPSILFHGDGRLQMLGRTRQSQLFSIESPDQGQSWGEMTLLDLPNNNSGTDAVTLQDGRHALIYNHTTRGRTPLNLAISKDGKHWTPVLTLEDQPGEYSYPAIIQTADGLLHVSYTWKRELVRYAVIDPTQLP